MRVFIAGEFSGRIREAFRALGHDAWSCDLLPAEDLSPRFAHHYVGDARELLAGTDDGPWDLLIAHPPCDYLANSGVQWLTRTPRNPSPGVLYGEARRDAMRAAAAFFLELWNAPIKRVAVENPIPHRYARTLIGRYTQLIQPYQFGHGETKATCLWLRGLPNLVPTNIVPGREGRCWKEAPGPFRKQNRSRTYQGIADAMAEQWGRL